MKEQFLRFVLLFGLMFVGCDNKNDILYVTGDDFLIKNGIVFDRSTVEDEAETLYYGNRKNKDWFALFDAESGVLLNEWYGQAREYVRNDGPTMTLASGWRLSKLKSGGYVYCFRPNNGSEKQLVRLLDNQKVEYGYVFGDDISVWKVLTENRFYCSSSSSHIIIIDFEGNCCVEDARYWEDKEMGVVLSTGFQNEKVWVGYYDKESDFREIVSSEKFERNRKVHVGYGEYREFYSDYIGVKDLIETDRGYAFSSNAYPSSSLEIIDVFFINGDKLVVVSSLQTSSLSLRNWYNGSVLAGKMFVLSLDGEIVREFSSGISENDEPVSYEEVVRYANRSFYRHNCLTNKDVWSINLDKLNNVESDAKVTMTILSKNGNLWTYQCDIVNKDGSKSSFNFKLNIETGEVTY